eukprot:TRINITY_DN14582_c0_g1_i1.p1 TRINITY_DN14582_c0_g1~~TRINITY_DN14582_c0_g1_i1.p1  ORF type:complete len:593 (+),score=98.55 TRINITY_DN14582_c0_g1_i1:315-2093(+)
MGNADSVPTKEGKKQKKHRKGKETAAGNGVTTATPSSSANATSSSGTPNGLTSSDRRTKKEPQKLELAKPVETSSSSEEETQHKPHNPCSDDSEEEDNSSDTNSFEMIGSSKDLDGVTFREKGSEGSIASSRESKHIEWKKGGVIGQGSFGKVYLGLNQVTGELLAVKQIVLEQQFPFSGDSSSDPSAFVRSKELEALQQEMSILRRLRHENIVRYYGTSREGCKLNIFLEYVPGGSLHSIIQKFGPLNEDLVSVYTRQILSGLHYLHRHNVIHRDIKGANVLVDDKGKVKLADFGASKRLNNIVPQGSYSEPGMEQNSTLMTRSLKGTVYWMAPEVIKQKGHGKQADIWSVGCTVIEMVTGKPPWSDFTDQVSAMYHIASCNKPPSLPHDLSSSLKDFALSCLRREHTKRPTAAQLLVHPFIDSPSASPSRLADDYTKHPRSRSNNLPSTSGNHSEISRKTRSFQQPHHQYSHRTDSSYSHQPKKEKARSEPFGESRKDPSMYRNPFSYFKTPGAAGGGAGASGVTTNATTSAVADAHDSNNGIRDSAEDLTRKQSHRRTPSVQPPTSHSPATSPQTSPRPTKNRDTTHLQ